MGLAADGSTINVSVQSVDAGIVGKALDTVAQADATNGEGFSKLLTLADKFITGAGDVIQKTQDTTLAQIQAVNAAANDKAGNIDQKTIMVGIGVAGAVAVAIALGGKK